MGGQRCRSERDSMGEVQIPVDALYGPQTQRAVENFDFSARRMPRPFLNALGLIKQVAARVNGELGLLELSTMDAVAAAAAEVAAGQHDAHFPVDVFQTGSGTSTNMNANEVIATLASRRLGRAVHPNDHVNRSQSSNDVFPSAIHVSASLELGRALLPSLGHLQQKIEEKAAAVQGVPKTARTHLMDAVPIFASDELLAWAQHLSDAHAGLVRCQGPLGALPLGGTAVGSGLNAPPEFGARCVAQLNLTTGHTFTVSPNRFASLALPAAAVELSGQLRGAAVAISKIANDLRWMNSGPLSGLGEVRLPALQPGSSIMPGKVNPVVPEAVCMACAEVVGNDATIAIAGQSGSFQLNVMLPLIAYDLLESIDLLANASRALADRVIVGLEHDRERLAEALDRNPILVTALNAEIGYERGAAIAKRAYREGRPILDVAVEETDLSRETLARLLAPRALARGNRS